MQKADAIARAETRGRILRLGVPTQPTVEARAWIRYNPRALSPIFLVPGLTAYLLGVGAVLLTALSIAREWEHGSMEQLFASPVGRFEIILGKLVPYLGIGMLQLLVILVVGTTVFDVPVRGSLLLLLGLALLFLVCMLGQGLLISATSRNQFLATQRGLITSLLPSLLLSGMLFPIDNMPMALKVISWAVPARYLVHAFRGIMLKGGGWETAWPDFVALSIFAVVVLTFATVRFQRRIA
jgi:ABC-2 type transport system permease protein